MKEDNIKTKIKKLNRFQTVMTLFKAFVGTAILYLPRAFYNGGWAITSAFMLASCFATIYCARLLLEVKEKTNCSNYSELGFKTMGRTGKILVDIALWSSQFGFCCAYVFFINENLHSLI